MCSIAMALSYFLRVLMRHTTTEVGSRAPLVIICAWQDLRVHNK